MTQGLVSIAYSYVLVRNITAKSLCMQIYHIYPAKQTIDIVGDPIFQFQ